MQPFPVDFFQVHSTACSIIRDIYKKVLRSILPLAPASRPLMTHNPELNLLHPSTIIHSAPLDSAYPVPSERERNDPKSPSASSTSGSPWGGGGVVGGGRSTPDAAMGGVGLGEMGMAGASQTDALQALIAGELPADRTLVGDGQKLTPGVIDLLLKVDGKLKVSATRSGRGVRVGLACGSMLESESESEPESESEECWRRDRCHPIPSLHRRTHPRCDCGCRDRAAGCG